MGYKLVFLKGHLAALKAESSIEPHHLNLQITYHTIGNTIVFGRLASRDKEGDNILDNDQKGLTFIKVRGIK